jgi:hypothetical protein
LERSKFENEKIMALWKGVMDHGQIGIRTIILINGAGATAILAFLGNAMKDRPLAQGNPLALHLGIAAVLFAFGVAAGFLATLCAYFNLYWRLWDALETGSPISKGKGATTRLVGVICAFAGLFTFLGGVGLSIWGFLRPG